MPKSQEKLGSGHKPNAAARRTRERYNNEHRREKNKLRRVRRSSGLKAAVAYAHRHGLTAWAKKRGIV